MKNRKSFNSKRGDATGELLGIFIAFTLALVIMTSSVIAYSRDDQPVLDSPVNTGQVVAPTTEVIGSGTIVKTYEGLDGTTLAP